VVGKWVIWEVDRSLPLSYHLSKILLDVGSIGAEEEVEWRITCHLKKLQRNSESQPTVLLT